MFFDGSLKGFGLRNWDISGRKQLSPAFPTEFRVSGFSYLYFGHLGGTAGPFYQVFLKVSTEWGSESNENKPLPVGKGSRQNCPKWFSPANSG